MITLSRSLPSASKNQEARNASQTPAWLPLTGQELTSARWSFQKNQLPTSPLGLPAQVRDPKLDRQQAVKKND